MQERIVVFLHLLGCDTNGHAHRPHSTIYSNNVRVVDRIAQRVQNLFEDYFGDNKTSYIFTADHGISDKGLKNLSVICLFLVFFFLGNWSLMFVLLSHIVAKGSEHPKGKFVMPMVAKHLESLSISFR